MSKKLIEVKNLKTYFSTNNSVIPAVDGIDLIINEGETIGIVGESGSGKSVTALSIMRLLKDTSAHISGSILFQSKNLLNLSEEEIRKVRGNDITIIFQEPMTSLNPVLTIGEQIREGVELHLNLPKTKVKNYIYEVLKSVGLSSPEEIYNEYPYSLSGGMRQRVMIAMAVSCNPKLLIADEPTTNLDVTIQAQIHDLLKQMKRENNMALLMITHDLGIVAEMCDKVIVMYLGRVMEEADVYTIFENPKHPYTKGLLKSIITNRNQNIDFIPGNVPNPQDLNKGCRFATRCSKSMDICFYKEPPLFYTDITSRSRCWLCKNSEV